MKENKELLKGKRIIYFAQEPSVRKWMLKNGISSISADLYNPADLQLDIEDTGLEDASCDIIICNHVLEHVTDYMKALRELHRIIKPDGRIIISFPVDTTLASVHENAEITTDEGHIQEFGQYDHRRVFGRDSAAIIESAGFEVEEIRGENFDSKIKPVVGPADYDYNVLWSLSRKA